MTNNKNSTSFEEFGLKEIDEQEWDRLRPKAHKTTKSTHALSSTGGIPPKKASKKSLDKFQASENTKSFIEMYPVHDIMGEDEQEIYYKILEMYMKDFDDSSLSAIDIDGILTLAMNRVLEKRLFKSMHEHPSDSSQIMPSIEKLQKQNEKIKESLGQRRKDRIDPREGGDITILDIVNSFDEQRKASLTEFYNNPEDASLRTSLRNKMESIIKRD